MDYALLIRRFQIRTYSTNYELTCMKSLTLSTESVDQMLRGIKQKLCTAVVLAA